MFDVNKIGTCVPPPPPPFVGFSKIPRLHRSVIVTEKIDGTNAQVHIEPDGRMLAGSRTRWVTPEDDNFGFAAWVRAHEGELSALGPGTHFGEWWGPKIQRGYGVAERRFSLFNTHRWSCKLDHPGTAPPACCSVVPVLGAGSDIGSVVADCLARLRQTGSVAAPGFLQPEGIVVYHTGSSSMFKVLLDNDKPKGLVN